MKNTILITGCSSGFGKLTAKLFHEKGWNVSIYYMTVKNFTYVADVEVSEAEFIEFEHNHVNGLIVSVSLAPRGPVLGWDLRELSKQQVSTKKLGPLKGEKATEINPKAEKGEKLFIKDMNDSHGE